MLRNLSEEINECFHKVLSKCIEIEQFKKVIIIFKENEFVWKELKNVFEKYAIEVMMVRIPLEENDINSWIPEKCENGLYFIEQIGFYKADLTIFGLPIEAQDTKFQKQLHDRFVEHQATRQPTIMFDWPPENISSSINALVSHMYLQALDTDVTVKYF